MKRPLHDFIHILHLMHVGHNIDIEQIKNTEFNPPKEISHVAELAYRDAITFASDYDLFKKDQEYEKNWRARMGWHLEILKNALEKI